MSISLGDDALRFAARQMANSLASVLSEAEEGVSAAFGEKMDALLRREKRRRGVRAMGRRAAAVVLTVTLGFGVVLAASPVARAAVSRWFLELTADTAIYHIPPADGGTAQGDRCPTVLPAGYTVSDDLTGRDGVRTVRCTSPWGDLLFKSVPLDSGAHMTAELRDPATAGIILADGTRPAGTPGSPEAYSVSETAVHGLAAQLYTFPEGGIPAGQCFELRFYRDGQAESFHSVSISPGAAALVWVDEESGRLFLLTGGVSGQDMLAAAESMYNGERT